MQKKTKRVFEEKRKKKERSSGVESNQEPSSAAVDLGAQLHTQSSLRRL